MLNIVNSVFAALRLSRHSGFSKPAGSSSQQRGGRSITFAERQDKHLQKTGRSNAVGTSRRKADVVVLDNGDGESADDDGASVYSRYSHAPSLHPSMAGSVMSEACHPDTIGAGDETMYWDYQHRTVERQDLGHKCRECRLPFTTIGEPLTERRGARVSMRYHAACFSGYADPRSQIGSSHHAGKLSGTQCDAAPGKKTGKMRTGAHFDGASAERTLYATTGKSGMGLGMGSNGFGVRSSRGTGLADDAAASSGIDMTPPTPSAGPGLSEGMLRAHQEQQMLVEGVSSLSIGRIAEEEESARPQDQVQEYRGNY